MKFFNNKLNFKEIEIKKINYIFFYKNIYLLYNFFIYYIFIIVYNLNNILKQTKSIYFIFDKIFKNKNLLLFFNIFIFFYNFFYNNKDIFLICDYKYINVFFYNFFKYSNYNNFLFIFKWILNLVKPIFFIECSLIPKKYIKKLKKIYIYKIKYLSLYYRIYKSLKLIKNYINYINYKNIIYRYIFCYLDLILNYKFSYIYIKKIQIYKKIFNL